MDNGSNNNGGHNTFYDLPTWVKNVDDISEYINATSAMGNVLKSLFGMSKSRHSGTNADRDAKKILHYGVRILLWLKRPQNENIEDVDLLIELYNELPLAKRDRMLSVLTSDAINKHHDIMKSIKVDEVTTTVDELIKPISNDIAYDDIYIHITDGVEYNIHAVSHDSNTVTMMQVGHTVNPVTYNACEFTNLFKLKGK